MKNLLKIFLPLVASVIYCLHVGNFTSTPALDFEGNYDLSTVQKGHFFAEPELPDGFFAVQEGSQALFSNSASSGNPKQLQMFKAVIQAGVVRQYNSYAQYLSEIWDSPIRNRKRDLLFPFHYFF